VSLITRIYSKLLHKVEDFTSLGSKMQLRSYQEQVCAAILKSIEFKQGLTFVVIFPRQSGKNEVQAQLEAFLLAKYCNRQVEMVKVAPTWIPQARISMGRLKRALEANTLTRGRWQRESTYIFRLGSARITFLSGSPSSNVVGATASLLLECDEAQDVMAAKWDKDFAPMTASENTTTVFWGTAWTANTLLAREMRIAQMQEKMDGVQRVFTIDAERVAQEVPAYGEHLTKQVARLGREHPLIKTQYFSEEIDSQSGMFSKTRQALMQGKHIRLERPEEGEMYALLLDVAGEDEQSGEANWYDLRHMEKKSRDATALTVVRVDTTSVADALLCAPSYQVVRRYLWSGVAHSELYGQIKALVEMWEGRYVVVDATGVGAGLASFLGKAFPERVKPVIFSNKSKSELGWRFLAVVEMGRYKEYLSEQPDDLQEQFWREVEHCQSNVKEGPGKMMSWGVAANRRDPESGEVIHDDLLISASLCSYLDLCNWGESESGVIPANDPLEGMGYVF
jgi:hypothetical protein